jgi:hypothetical protein
LRCNNCECDIRGTEWTNHAWMDATCNAPKTCAKCGETDANYPATGSHTPITIDGGNVVCAVCGACKHTWDSSIITNVTCTEAAVCSMCEMTITPAPGHDIYYPVANKINHTAKCRRVGCDYSVTAAHTFNVDGECDCGQQRISST